MVEEGWEERERHSERKTYRYWETGEKDMGPGTGESKRETERAREMGEWWKREREGGESKREGVKLREAFKQPRETERREMENLMSHQDTVSLQERVREGWVKGVRGSQCPPQKCTSCQPQLFRGPAGPAVDNNARLFERLRDHYLRGETFS